MFETESYSKKENINYNNLKLTEIKVKENLEIVISDNCLLAFH